MKLLNARIKGLIGLYRGSNLKEIYIDFTKCLNKVTLIVGGNGSGKTTLLSALNPIPDPQSNYIDGEEGFKELEYLVNGILYHLLIQYPVNKYGERTTTKAYISKTIGNEVVELNPNGNVTSYKDLLFTEFKLDSNFAALTSLSIEDKGIVHKTPAERKKYVGSIVSTVEVYNNIYKTLNKRSSVFKSMINSLVSKIDTIGSQENIEATLKSINMRIDTLSKSRDILMKKLSGAETMVQSLDPNNQIQTQYNEIYSQLTSVKTQIETINMFISKYMVEPYMTYISDRDKCSHSYIDIDKEIAVLESESKTLKDSLQNLLMEKEEDSRTLIIKVNKMNSLRSQYNFDELFKQLKKTKDNIDKFRTVLSELGLSENTTLTKDEFILGLSTLKNIKCQIDTFRSFAFEDQIEKAIGYVINNIFISKDINELNNSIDSIKDELDSTRQGIAFNKGLLQKTDILSKRPGKCNIDSCPFIEDALNAFNQNPNDTLKTLELSYRDLENKLEVFIKQKEELETISQIILSLGNILAMIRSNSGILNKLPNGTIFTDTESFIMNLRNGNTFDNINDIYQYIDCANLFEEYRIDKERLVKLESEHEIYKNRNDIINEISLDIDKLQSGMNSIVLEIESSNKKIFELDTLIQKKKSLIQVISGMNSKYEELDRLNAEMVQMEDTIKGMAMNMKAIEQAIQDINAINSELMNLDNELNPIKEERDSLKYSLSRLKEYCQELDVYSAKYNKVEVVKKYSSPTKAGIQNLFIDVYMGQTRAIANELLSMFFGGKLKLLKYNINENEFKIPCTSIESSINNDDVSSCSGGERAVIAMILSFALLQQSSSIYNILRLDEIDGTLDQYNRGIFMELLYIIMDRLGVDNCIMISHASESVLDNADIIYLNMDGLSIPKGNVIYSIAT